VEIVRFWYPANDLHLPLLFIFCAIALIGQPCKSCHPKEVEGYAQTAMARSISPASDRFVGSFLQQTSQTRFESQTTSNQLYQSYSRLGESAKLPAPYAIGSGDHAVGFLLRAGDHLFQSPISYYTRRKLWDMAPGYEQASHPDFSRPVTAECLTCHSNSPQPVPETLNTYRTPAFDGGAISCERCHGSAAEHLKKPIPGSILNPAKLPVAARDSICEQCHLAGEIRIPNPGRSLTDFRPGQTLEDVYTVYVKAQSADGRIKVISHSEQLAQSLCARRSAGKLWCATCHNPHDKPANPVAYFRDRCLSCHAATLPQSHATPEQGCTGCHMPQRPAKDGGHTAFTDHRIRRHPDGEVEESPANADPMPWREPAGPLRARNLALAQVTLGLQDSSSAQVIRGFRTLSRLEPSLSNDPLALTELGTILLTAKQPGEAEKRFRRALQLRPDFAPYEVNLASALADEGDLAQAKDHFERALKLDPLLQTGVYRLAALYRQMGQAVKADQLLAQYRTSMGIVEEHPAN
jgi:hypothetical protein